MPRKSWDIISKNCQDNTNNNNSDEDNKVDQSTRGRYHKILKMDSSFLDEIISKNDSESFFFKEKDNKVSFITSSELKYNSTTEKFSFKAKCETVRKDDYDN